MSYYSAYKDDISKRKKIGLNPKPIEDAELTKELILIIKDKSNKYRKECQRKADGTKKLPKGAPHAFENQCVIKIRPKTVSGEGANTTIRCNFGATSVKGRQREPKNSQRAPHKHLKINV